MHQSVMFCVQDVPTGQIEDAITKDSGSVQMEQELYVSVKQPCQEIKCYSSESEVQLTLFLHLGGHNECS